MLAPMLYFLPALLGWWLKRESLAGIIILNLFLGWTGVGWIAALVWAVAARR
jgi:hypothetical protein